MRAAFKRRLTAAILFPLAIATVLPLVFRSAGADREVVVYCAHDSIFADEVLREFTRRTGIRVTVRYDEESSKSLGLTELLLSEREAPRCDVFWNNQVLGTIRLQRAGVLQRCPEEWFARIPARYRDPAGHWCGFAGRFRVWIVNTTRMQADAKVVESAFSGGDLSRCGIAVPLFGTTLTHYTEMAREAGLAGLRSWHESLRERGIREARGNGAVRDLVAAGVCDFGLTDTDDFFAARDAGSPVAMLPSRLPSGGTICIPNTVSLIRGSRHRGEAEELLKYLLSAEVELRLAQSSARQVPLGEVEAGELPAELRPLLSWLAESVEPSAAAGEDRGVLEWLRGVYGVPRP